MPRSRPGQLKHRLTLQYNLPTRNTYGENIDAWTDLVTIYGGLRPVTGIEQVRGGADRAIATHIATIRHRGTSWTFAEGGVVEFAEGGAASFYENVVNEAQRIKYASRFFDVVSVVNVNEAHAWGEMVLREVRQ